MRAAGGRVPLAGIVSIATLAAAALLSLQVVRSAAVADRDNRPELAQALWPAHPSVLIEKAFLAIATAASRGMPVPEATRADVLDAARKSPLSPDPFVIEGAIAQSEGQGEEAERLLLAAKARDPRSRGARFLLADRYIRSGRIAAGLFEMQALVNLQSRGVEAFGPALAGYARSPGAVPQLRRFFTEYPRVEASVLSVLAADAANANLVLSLASNLDNPNPDWRGTLVQALASAGQYARAYAIWARLSRVRPVGGLFNPGFADVGAPGPFNWEYPQSSEGVAEPDGEGGLSVLYYGRARAALAGQSMLLKPGRYRLEMAVESAVQSPDSLHWILVCAADGKPLADMQLRAGAVAGSFEVPTGCIAQRLELVGLPGDRSETTEAVVRRLRLAAHAGG